MAFITVTKETKTPTKEVPVKKPTIKIYSNGCVFLNKLAQDMLGLIKGNNYSIIFQVDEANKLVRFKADQKGETSSRNGVFTINKTAAQNILEWYKAEAFPSPRKTDEKIMAVFVDIKTRSDKYTYLAKPKEEATLAE